MINSTSIIMYSRSLVANNNKKTSFKKMGQKMDRNA